MQTPMSHLASLYLFGSPRLERAGSSVHIDTRKGYALLAWLAVTRTPQSRDTLAALLYPENDDTSARAALRRTLSAVNTALEGVGLLIERESLAIDFDTLWVDVVAFEGCLKAGNAAEAVGLVHGDFLAGFTLRDSPEFDRWQSDQSERFRRRFGSALEKVIEAAEQRRAFEDAIVFARRWLDLDMLHEPVHRKLMALYAQSGQHSAAIHQYRECVRVLDEELGIAPLDETTALYQAVLENKGGTPVVSTSTEEPRIPPIDARLPLVGREQEEVALRALRGQRGNWIVIEGEPGIGKTRLAEWFTDIQRTSGQHVYATICYEGESGLAYAPFIDLLRKGFTDQRTFDALPALYLAEIGKLLPELIHGAKENSVSMNTPGAPLRLFEAVHETLREGARDAPLVLYIDDLHWTDTASLDLLMYLLRRLDGMAVTLVTAWRAGEFGSDHPLRRLLTDRVRAGRAATFALNRLHLSDIVALVQYIAPQIGWLPAQVASVSEKLYRETEGLPFLVAEYLAMRDPTLPDLPLMTISNLIQSRLARIDGASVQVLGAASVIEHTFDDDLLRSVSGRTDDEVLDALEVLTARGLLSELDSKTATYGFSHEKIRMFVYSEIGSARKRLLHRRVAEVLRHRPEKADPNRIAVHYCLAGHEREAADFFWQAGENARKLYAYHEALKLYQLALESGYPDRFALHEAMAISYTLPGNYPQALDHLHLARQAVESGEQASRIERQIGNVCQRMGDPIRAEHHLSVALDGLPPESLLQRAAILADWSLAAHTRGDLTYARQLADHALNLAEQVGHTAALAQVHNMLGILSRAAGAIADSIFHLDQSVYYATQLADSGVLIAAMNNLALTHRDAGHFEDAVSLFGDVINRCEHVGDRHRLAALHNGLADTLHLCGDEPRAIMHLKKAVVLFSELGSTSEPYYPDVWRLVEW